MLKSRDCAKRCNGERKFDLVFHVGPKQCPRIAVTAPAEAFAGIFKLETIDRGDEAIAVLLNLHEGENLLHDRPARSFEFPIGFADHIHGECASDGWNQTHDGLINLRNPPCGIFNIALGIAKLPANGVLIIDMAARTRSNRR